MKRLSRLIPLIILVYLFSVSTSFADSLQVNFSATIPVSTIGETTVSGSFLWDTQTQLLSNISLTSSGPFTFLPIVQYIQFAGPNLGFVFGDCCYPVGSLILLDFQDPTHTITFQINYNDHLFTDPPLFPGPGVHFNLPIFDICGVGIGCNPGTGDVTVSAVAEPGIALLLIFGVLVLGAAFALKHFNDNCNRFNGCVRTTVPLVRSITALFGR